MAATLDTLDPLICVHCLARLGISTSTQIESEEAEVCNEAKRQKLNTNESDLDTAFLSEICTVCLDILNPIFVHKISSAVVANFVEQNYDSTTFAISTIIPFSIWVREYLTCLANGLTFIFQDRKSALKRQLRKVYSACISSCSTRNLRYDPNSNLEITIEIRHREADSQVSLMATLLYPLDQQRRGKSNTSVVTFATVERILLYNDLAKFRDLNVFPLVRVASHCELSKINYASAPLYLAGRYNKYSRNISQTPWSLEGEEVKLESVEKIISEPVMRIFSPSEIRFTASGREDIDVRMLGTGRPFLLELLNPKRTSQSKERCKQIEDELKVNEFVNISLFTTAAKGHTPLIKTGEAMNKTYKALLFSKCGFSNEHISTLNEVKDIELKQKTPIRVLHRRSPATRVRTIYTMSALLRDQWHAAVDLTTQSGTYIKEFVHGDMGRTQPNLRQLLGLPDLDIVELDVLNVALEWPVNK